MNNGSRELGASGAGGNGGRIGNDAETTIPLGFEAAILGLTANQCRWPFGNPDESDFHFCTAGKVSSVKPYCAAHAWDARLVKGGKRPVVVSFGDVAARGEPAKPKNTATVTPEMGTGGQSSVTRAEMAP